MILTCFLILSSCSTLNNSDRMETADLHMQIGISHLQRENYPEALKEFLIAEDLAPSNPAVQSNLALTYFFREKYDLAEKHYLKSISLKPNFTEAKNNLARVYIEIGKLNKAEPLLKEVLKDLTFSEYPSAYTNYGILEFKRSNFIVSKNLIKKSLEIDRESCENHLYLGRNYLELNEISLAVDQLDKSITFCKDRNTDEPLYYSALANYRNKQRDRAMVRFEELLQLYPTGKNSEKTKKMLDLIRKGNI